MKNKILVSLFLLLASGTATFSQCVPDPTITDPGVYPDSATGLPPACLNQPYSTTIQVRVLTDTVLNGLPVVITSVEITSVTGLPAGFTYACVPSSCNFPGGSNGCIQLTGTPTSLGSFPLVVTVTAYGTIFGVPVPPQASTVNYYSIQVNSCVGIAENISNLSFDLLQNNPNPFTGLSEINFTTPASGTFTFKVFNLIGKEIFRNSFAGNPGINFIRLDARDFVPGIYMYSLGNGITTLTRRMIVSEKK